MVRLRPRGFRRLIAMLVLPGAIGIGLAALTATPSAANHRPKAYCSPTGDLCYGARKVNGEPKLKIDSFVDFGSYRLCVRKQGGPPKECHNFALHPKAGGIFGDTVKWSSAFTDQGPGAYLARWKQSGSSPPFGPRIGFHVQA